MRSPRTRDSRHRLNASTNSSRRRAPPSPSPAIPFVLITCTHLVEHAADDIENFKLFHAGLPEGHDQIIQVFCLA
jgi:hypothetical protein